MRLRVFLVLFLLFLLPALAASADIVPFGDMYYVYPEREVAPTTLTLSAQGEVYDPVTLEPSIDSTFFGAVFGVYAKGADGAFVPYPDPANPLRPWKLTAGANPLRVSVPRGVDLYIRQDETPEGYAPGPAARAYTLLTFPADLTFTNHQVGVQGVRIRLTADSGTGNQPLAGVPFMLISADGAAYDLTTDGNGVATRLDIPAGSYVLRQQAAPEHYSIDDPEIHVNVEELRPTRVEAQNSRNGFLALNVLGETVDGARNTQHVPLARQYEVFDANGASMGLLTSGETMPLTASQEGITYTVRAAAAPIDGFAMDAATYTVTLVCGQTVTCEARVRTNKGFFSFTHVSSRDSAAVPGGSFTLYDQYDNEMMAFDADDRGRFTPALPLAPGTYTLRMSRAGEGCVYSDADYQVQIEPYLLTDPHPVTEVTFESDPLPEALMNPFVTANAYALPSLFDAKAEIDFTFELLGGNPPLPCSDILFEFAIPEVAGLELIEKRPDGASFTIERRIQSNHLEELFALSISGKVRFTFTYPISATETREIPVEGAFMTTVATFASSTRTEPYAILGRVTDENRRPVSGVLVSLEDASGLIFYDSMRSDAYGAYAFLTRPEGSVLRFQTQLGYGVRMNGDDATVRPLEVYTGSVVAHGVDGYPVTLVYGQSGPVSPGADGAFAITGVFDPEDKLIVQAPEGVLARVEESSGAPVVNLYPAAAILGRAADSDGDTVPLVAVTLRGEGIEQTTLTGADGAYTFAGLFPGEYTLAYAAPESHLLDVAETRAVSVASGEQKWDENIALVKPSAIHGVIADSGKPVEGVTVTLAGAGLSATSGADGSFAFASLRVGTYALSYELPDNVLLPNPPGTVTVTSPGEAVALAVDAVRPATIAGRIWQDTDDDGIMADSEPGQSGVRLTLLSEQGEALTEMETARDGTFSFGGLLPGGYRIAAELPEEMIFARETPGAGRMIAGIAAREGMSGTLTVASGQTLDGLLCGAAASGTINGVVFEDLDASGMWDEGEPLLGGVAVALLSGSDVVETTTTDGQGNYRFSGLRLGDYRVRVTLPEGCIFTTQREGGFGVSSALPTVDAREAERDVSLSTARVEAKINAGALRVAMVNARVWFDADADGTDRGEDGYRDMRIELYSVTSDGDVLVAAAQTGEDGKAAFANLRPGAFRLRYSLPSAEWGFLSGVETTEGDLLGIGPAFAFAPGETDKRVDASIAKRGSISGVVFVDPDYDGLRAENSTGVVATVTLLNLDGVAVAETQSDAGGAYAFLGVLPGRYTLRFEVPEGYAFTANRTDAPSFNSDVPETSERVSETAQLYLPSGEAPLVDAGVYLGASVSGAVWHDARGTGMYAGGNTPIADCPVVLMRGTHVQGETVTARDGTYSFDMLPPGEYTVRVTLPGGMLFSPQSYEAGRASMIIPNEGNAGTTSVLLISMGEKRADIDAGAIYTGSVGGVVTKMGTDQGLPEIAVTLVQNGTPVGQTVTDENGKYRFNDTPAGKMELHFELPQDWLFAPDQNSVVEINIPQQKPAPDVDVQLLPQTVMEGFIWVDANFDNVVDADEEPLSAAMVTLRKHETPDEALEEGDIISVAGTKEDGKFRFDKLQPGYYSIRIVPPEGAVMYNGEESTMVTLAMGENVEFKASGYYASFIMGTVWDDINGNGVRDAEEMPLDDVPVALLDMDGNVVVDSVTDLDGRFLFNELPPITCRIRVTLPEGYVFPDNEGAGAIVDVDGSVGMTAPMTLTMGSSVTDIDVGGMWPATIGDTVWIDENGNGLQDTAEPGAEGVTVSLWHISAGGGRELAAETRTDANGRYLFEGVRPGQYQMSVELGRDYLPTRRFDGLDQINSKLVWRVEGTRAYTETFEAPAGAILLTIDAGILPRATAEGLGWTVGGDGTITAP